MKKILVFILPILLICNHLQAQVNVNNTDVSHYHIHLTDIDFSAHSITAYTDVEFSLTETASEVGLYLLSLNVDSVKHNNTLVNFEYNDTIINILWNGELNANTPESVRVYYHGNPVKDPSGWGGIYFSGQYAFNLGAGFKDLPHNYGRVWFPCVDNFTDRATYNFSIHTDIDSKAACNGVLTQVDTLVNGTDSSLVHHWNMTSPIPTYLASFAVGKYDIVEWIYQGIENDIPVKLYVYPNTTNQATGSFAKLDSITRTFETLFGAYPWQRIGYVAVQFSGGAMEHASNIAIPKAAINGGTGQEGLFAHELSHHWFGNYITCHQAEEMWINEGWATYCETIHKEFIYGEKSGKDFRRTSHKNVILKAHTNDGGWYALNAVPLEVTYGTTTYEKGGSIVHSLRDYLGDELFFSGVKSMLTEKAMQDISSYEMRDILTNHTGVNLNNFFDNWVFKPGLPHYKLDSFDVVNNGGNYDITVWVKQQLYGRNTLSDGNMVNIGFVDNNYNVHEKRMSFDGEFGTQTFNLSFNPLMLAIDINEKCSDAKVSQCKVPNATGEVSFNDEFFKMNISNIQDSAFMYVSHHWGAPSEMKTPVEGLVLANHRYWHIDGDFTDDFSASAVFSYYNGNSGIYMDSEFINGNSLDSLRIMYRPNQKSEWTMVENQSNSKFLRKITIDNLLPGEYTLAMYDWETYHAVKDDDTFKFSVFPNPANKMVSIQSDENFNGTFYILDNLGHEILTAKLNPENNCFHWQSTSSKSGIYHIVFLDKSGKKHTEKLILQ